MSNAQIIYERRIGIGARGQDVLSSEVYMKLLVSFMRDGSLRRLKGAPLSTFNAVGLHEAEIQLGLDDVPFGVREIMAVTGWSKPMVVNALDFLVGERYIVELPERNRRGEKQYRIAAYMWFGDESPSLSIPCSTRGDVPPRAGRVGDVPPSVPEQADLERPTPEDVPSRVVGSKQNLLPPEVKNLARSKKFYPHDDDVHHNSEHDLETSSIHDLAAARKIFAAAGFQGPWLEDVARVVAPMDRVRLWADWTVRAKRVPDQFPRPYGYTHKVYRHNPFNDPPEIVEPEAPEEPVEIPDAATFGLGAAGELWRAAIVEMQNSLGRDVMELLIQSRIVDYDRTADGVTLIVLDPTHYFLKRLLTMITRAVEGIAECHCDLVVIDEVNNDKAENA